MVTNDGWFVSSSIGAVLSAQATDHKVGHVPWVWHVITEASMLEKYCLIR